MDHLANLLVETGETSPNLSPSLLSILSRDEASPMSTTPLSDILSRLSYELHALADSTEEFHHLAFNDEGSCDVPRGLDDAAFVKAAQSIDVTQQILANLSEFVGCLAMAAPTDMRLDPQQALSLITLSDLKARLVEAPAGAAEAERQEAGDADMFF